MADSQALNLNLIGENREDFFQREELIPTGISKKVFSDRVEIYWHDFDNQEEIDDSLLTFIGYNIYFGLTPGLSKREMVRINGEPISEPFEERDEVLSEDSDEIVAGDEITTVTTKKIKKRNIFRFRHFLGNIVSSLKDRPVFYRISSIFFDQTTNFLFESLVSDELAATPMSLNTGFVDLPLPSFRDFVQFHIENIKIFDNELDVKPGSPFRDLIIDPVSDNMVRLHFLLNFMSRSQSFVTLLDIDDPNKDGVSDAISQVPFKRNLKNVLNLSDDDVQILVDTCFDKLANNVNVRRKTATRSVGEITLSSPNRPESDVSISRGSLVSSAGNNEESEPAITFETTSDVFVNDERVDDLRNPDTGMYEVTVPARSTVPGSVGNVDAGDVVINISANNSEFPNVSNKKPFAFGEDFESNRDLATRAMLAFVSVDVGTKGGYKSSALSVSGCRRASVVGAGHPLMMRDLDCFCNKHLLGDVDVYVLGDDTGSVEEENIVEYELVSARGSVVDAINFRVKINTDLDQVVLLEASNVTKGAAYDVTGATVNGVNEWDLDEGILANSTIGMDSGDVLFLRVRVNKIKDYIFENQPVLNIASVTTESGVLLIEGVDYDLFKLEDPLLLGESSKANDFMRLYESSPSLVASYIERVERKIMVDEETVLLDELAPDPRSVVVRPPASPLTGSIDVTASTAVVGTGTLFLTELSIGDLLVVAGQIRQVATITNNLNLTVTTAFVDSANDLTPEFIDTPTPFIISQDYLVLGPDKDKRAYIRRVDGSAIVSGRPVTVSYRSPQKITIEYEFDNLVNRVAAVVEDKRHITADVVVKRILKPSIDIEFTVGLLEGVSAGQVDFRIRTVIGQFFAGLGIGVSVHQSDIVALAESVTGVDFVVLPFHTLVRGDDSLIIREPVTFLDFTTNNTTPVKTFTTNTGVLKHSTTEGGGDSKKPRGVFVDDKSMLVVDTQNEVRLSSNRAFIHADGKLTVSVPSNDPSKNSFTVTYQVAGEEGPKEINAGDNEQLVLGDLLIEYKEAE